MTQGISERKVYFRCGLRNTKDYGSGNAHRTIDKGRAKATGTHKQMAF